MKTERRFACNHVMMILFTCMVAVIICSGCDNYIDGDDDDDSYEMAYDMPMAYTPLNGAAHDDMFFEDYRTNPFIDTEDEHLSTFGMDVDTASYSIARRYIRDGHLPPPKSIRVEEFVNAFDYEYAPPTNGA
ncbi:von Willebrand factor type A domain-containing protein, partial [Candidatus Poribacteria bacterium]